ncbi:extracellular solute-binding protein [Quadrisphaera sp. INWT6]|uniref:ABC transporter substrate-binding protein n=1 Tax=Quadrisphaera sp. INWT6 TaxID=2596917 RepID=UPI001891F55F|nr:extracellular solute-binding protein [Quadrisphaera sp. INWT6]MBF5082235.1 carbohydrate ABC transporter substrate-binding protein [Quadrisphaera sp. INWT6]
MSLSRRSFLLTAGLLGAAGSSVLTACGSGGATGAGDGDGKDLAFWYWSGAISDTVVKDVAAAQTGITITPSIIGGDFKQKLTTTLSAGQSVPDITGVKGEDMPSFLTQSEAFLDLNDLGAKDIASSFSAAKYAAATTKDGKQIGLPIDLGPTATYYREDSFAAAGLPTDPTAAGEAVATWDGWFDAAKKVKAATGAASVRNTTDIFAVALAQQPSTFVTEDGAWGGESDAVKKSWDLAVQAHTDGVSGAVFDGTGYNQALAAGTIVGHVGPAWFGLDIASGAPDTSGKWRVTQCPDGPANIGGSFLTLTTACRNPQASFEYIKTLLSADNAAKSFTDASVFPATLAAYDLPALTAGQDFYGGQATIEVFGPAAQALPTVYDDANNAAIAAPYYTELSNVEGGKDATTAWNDAVSAAKQIAQRAGVQ